MRQCTENNTIFFFEDFLKMFDRTRVIIYIYIFRCVYGIIGEKQTQRSSTFMATFGIKNVKGISIAATMAAMTVSVVVSV